MNATVLPESLYKAAKTAKIAEWNKTLLVLNHALLYTADDGYLHLATCSLDEPEKCADAKIAARVESPFAVCVPMIHKTTVYPNGWRNGSTRTFHPFPDFCKVLAETYGEAVTLEYLPASCELVIRAGNSKTTFKCMDAANFPALPQ